MPDGNILKYGILRCRDLVELYFGARMVATVAELASPVGTANPQLIFGDDLRRISYEIVLTNANNATRQSSK